MKQSDLYYELAAVSFLRVLCVLGGEPSFPTVIK